MFGGLDQSGSLAAQLVNRTVGRVVGELGKVLAHAIGYLLHAAAQLAQCLQCGGLVQQ
ncbi:hypothetical protein D3C77_268600 [compost metagenome]